MSNENFNNEAASALDLRAVLIEVQNALKLANEMRDGGPICDTIWMPERSETLFDFIESAIEAASASQSSTAGAASVCLHDGERKASYSHITCLECGAIRTDGEWGIASRMWFKSEAEAKFYEKNGRYPEAISSPVPRVGGPDEAKTIDTPELRGILNVIAAHGDITHHDIARLSDYFLAHIAPQAAADTGAASVDTPEFRAMLARLGGHVPKDFNKLTLPLQDLIRHIETVYGAQQREAGRQEKRAEFDAIFDAFGIGSEARTSGVLMANIRHTLHFAELLHAVEREFFMVPGEPDEEFGEEPGEECLLNCWGSSVEEYIEQFRAALARLSAVPPAKAEGMSDEQARNAARYMWLRSRDRGMAGLSDTYHQGDAPPFYELKCEEELDAAIDRAILAQQAKKGGAQ